MKRILLATCLVLFLIFSFLWSCCYIHPNIMSVRFGSYLSSDFLLYAYKGELRFIHFSMTNHFGQGRKITGKNELFFRMERADITPNFAGLIDSSDSKVTKIAFSLGEKEDLYKDKKLVCTIQDVSFPLWLLMLATSIPVFIILVRKCSAHLKRSSIGLCKGCGYDLRASKKRCPECGKEF